MVPTRRLALVALVLAVPVLLAPGHAALTLLAANAVLLVVAVVDFTRAVRPGQLIVERDLPGVVPLGGEAQVVWRVRNPEPRPVVVALADELAPSLSPESRRARLVVAARGEAWVATTVRPTRRGRFEVAEMVVRVEGPLGLAARQGSLRRPAVLAVHPRYRSATEAQRRIRAARALEAGLRSAAGRGGGTEFDSLREYSVDDEVRRIDWAATARAGRAIVRTYRSERNQTVLCLLDNGRTMAARVEGVPRSEHAMDAVMMLTHVASRLGDRAGLLAFDRQVRAMVGPRHGAGQLARVTEALYQLEPTLVESDYRHAFQATLSRYRRRSLVVLCTELAEEAFSENLLPHLPLVGRHHLVMVAAVVDPAVVRWAVATPRDAGGAYRKAAAIAALAERCRVARRLRAVGATVVDAPPGELATRLTDAYLRVKATGRL